MSRLPKKERVETIYTDPDGSVDIEVKSGTTYLIMSSKTTPTSVNWKCSVMNRVMIFPLPSTCISVMMTGTTTDTTLGIMTLVQFRFGFRPYYYWGYYYPWHMTYWYHPWRYYSYWYSPYWYTYIVMLISITLYGYPYYGYNSDTIYQTGTPKIKCHKRAPD